MTLGDLVAGVVVLVVVGLMAYGLFAIAMTGWMASKDQKAKEQAPDLLDQLFNGAEDVVYKTGTVGSLPFEDVILGAKERGYRLSAQEPQRGGGSTLVFSRTPEWHPREPQRARSETPEQVPTGGGSQTAQVGLLATAGVLAIILGTVVGDIWSVILFGVAAIAFAAGIRLYITRPKT